MTTNQWEKNLAQKRTKCEIFTRVMGYYRPVRNFNPWKKSEHYSRKHYNVDLDNLSINQQFIKQYSCYDNVIENKKLNCEKTVA